MEKKKKNEIYDAIGVAPDDSEFLGQMPAGKVKCIGIGELKKYEGKDWQAVQFQTVPKTSDIYELSLKGLIRAEGLKYPSRNFRERGDLWLDGALVGKEFDWKGKVERKGIRKRKTQFGEAGSEYTLNVYTFGEKKVVG